MILDGQQAHERYQAGERNLIYSTLSNSPKITTAVPLFSGSLLFPHLDSDSRRDRHTIYPAATELNGRIHRQLQRAGSQFRSMKQAHQQAPVAGSAL